MGRAIIQGSGIQYSIIINLSCWLLSSALISNLLNVDKMCIQAQYHWFSHQNNKKQANKNIYNTSYLCGSLMQLVNHEIFNLDKPSWAPPPLPTLYAGICWCIHLAFRNTWSALNEFPNYGTAWRLRHLCFVWLHQYNFKYIIVCLKAWSMSNEIAEGSAVPW